MHGESGPGAGATGIVFNIQRYTIHDGPGIRTGVFFKGCNLRCLWCSNPESLNKEIEVGVFPNRCIGIDKCAYCFSACPYPGDGGGGLFFVEDNKIAGINRAKCVKCFKCAAACPANALKPWGEEMSVRAVMKLIMADRAFYEKSGGGVTLSGGEVLMQPEFAFALLKACKAHNLHTCVESALHCRKDTLDLIFPYVDLMITDIKHLDTEQHKRLTGAGNELILNNIKDTVLRNMPLVIRIPVVPGYNNDLHNIRATAQFIATELNNRVRQVQLLPYRKLGTEKYKSLGLDYPLGDYAPPQRSEWEQNIRELVETMKSYGVPAVAGTTTRL